MEITKCFNNVGFVKKDAFYVAGLEVDINYNTENGIKPISGAWEMWKNNDYELPKSLFKIYPRHCR